MKSSFLPKYEPNIVRISALYIVPHYRAEILTISTRAKYALKFIDL
jgi:hypothetical protein